MKKTNKALRKLKEELEKFMGDGPITVTMQSTRRKQVEDLDGFGP